MPNEINSQQPSTEETLKPLRTFEGDLAEAINSGESLSSMALAENERRTKNPGTILEAPVKPSRQKLFLAIIISALAIGTLVLGAVVYLGKSSNPSPTNDTPTEAPTSLSLILADQTKNIDATGSTISNFTGQLIDLRDQGNFTLNTLAEIRFFLPQNGNRRLLTTNEFLTLLGWNPTDILVRSLSSEFVFGFHNFKRNEPFLVFKTRAYQTTFAEMLNWENELRLRSYPLFVRTNELLGGGATTTDTLIGNRNLAFTDAVIKNRDTRALYDRAGNLLLLYTFADQETVILTTNSDTLIEVIKKLLANKMIR